MAGPLKSPFDRGLRNRALSKSIFHNFEELQEQFNERVDKLLDTYTTPEALQVEQSKRFDSYEVPEITSPPLDWNHSFLQHKWNIPGHSLPSTKEVLESLACFIGPPLVDDELTLLHQDCMKLCDLVSGRLHWEFVGEKSRIENYIKSDCCRQETSDFFRDPDFGAERVDIVTRHFVKRRWQRLGLWMRRWGIPGRCYQWSQERDDFSRWSDPWRAAPPESSYKEAAAACVDDLVKLRGQFSRGLWPIMEPRSILTRHSYYSEVWDFITSRPWFLFEVEMAEESIRFRRLPRQVREMFDSHVAEPGDLKNRRNRVVELWNTRAVMSKGWLQPPDSEKSLVGWWWPHEIGPPDEEDLDTLNQIYQEAPDTTLPELDYGFSEFEALQHKAPEEVTISKRDKRYISHEQEQGRIGAETRERTVAAMHKHSDETRQYAGEAPAEQPKRNVHFAEETEKRQWMVDKASRRPIGRRKPFLWRGAMVLPVVPRPPSQPVTLVPRQARSDARDLCASWYKKRRMTEEVKAYAVCPTQQDTTYHPTVEYNKDKHMLNLAHLTTPAASTPTDLSTEAALAETSNAASTTNEAATSFGLVYGYVPVPEKGSISDNGSTASRLDTSEGQDPTRRNSKSIQATFKELFGDTATSEHESEKLFGSPADPVTQRSSQDQGPGKVSAPSAPQERVTGVQDNTEASQVASSHKIQATMSRDGNPVGKQDPPRSICFPPSRSSETSIRTSKSMIFPQPGCFGREGTGGTAAIVRNPRKRALSGSSSDGDDEDPSESPPSPKSVKRPRYGRKTMAIQKRKFPVEFEEDRMPSPVELQDVQRTASEMTRRLSPLRQIFVPSMRVPEAPLEDTTGYEGDDERLPRASTSVKRRKISHENVLTKEQRAKNETSNTTVDGDTQKAAEMENGQIPEIAIIDKVEPTGPTDISTTPIKEEPQDESIQQIPQIDQTPKATVNKLEKPASLGPVRHGVMKRATKYPKQYISKAPEQRRVTGAPAETPAPENTSSGEPSNDTQPQEVSESVSKDSPKTPKFTEDKLETSVVLKEEVSTNERPSVLRPVTKAGVRKRGSKKTEHTGPLRRSTRAAALQATAKLAMMKW